MRFVIQNTDTLEYLKSRPHYWKRRDLIKQNNGDDTTWSHDLQKARVFSSESAAANAYTHEHNVKIVEVALVKKAISNV